jgi:ISXO2-like transposase domain
MENAFSLLKCGVYGTFHKVSIKHLGRYGHEFSFRWHRRGEPLPMFDATLKSIRNETAREKAHGFASIGVLAPRRPRVFIFLRGSGLALSSLASAWSNFRFSTFILRA